MLGEKITQALGAVTKHHPEISENTTAQTAMRLSTESLRAFPELGVLQPFNAPTQKLAPEKPLLQKINFNDADFSAQKMRAFFTQLILLQTTLKNIATANLGSDNRQQKFLQWGESRAQQMQHALLAMPEFIDYYQTNKILLVANVQAHVTDREIDAMQRNLPSYIDNIALQQTLDNFDSAVTAMVKFNQTEIVFRDVVLEHQDSLHNRSAELFHAAKSLIRSPQWNNQGNKLMLWQKIPDTIVELRKQTSLEQIYKVTETYLQRPLPRQNPEVRKFCKLLHDFMTNSQKESAIIQQLNDFFSKPTPTAAPTAKT